MSLWELRCLWHRINQPRHHSLQVGKPGGAAGLLLLPDFYGQTGGSGGSRRAAVSGTLLPDLRSEASGGEPSYLPPPLLSTTSLLLPPTFLCLPVSRRWL